MGIEFAGVISKVLGTPSINRVFKSILRSRVLSRYQLESHEGYNKEEIDKALNMLVAEGLIDKQSGQIQQWDTFYPTREGLLVEKIVK